MSQENYTTDYVIRKEKNKKLSESELGRLEECLNNNEKTGSIAEKLGTDASTIKKLVSQHRYVVYSRFKKKKCSQCVKYKTCELKKLCENSKEEYSNCNKCKDCNIAADVCKEYEPVVNCPKLKGHKKVCNGCGIFKTCNKTKLVFTAKKTILNREKSKKNSIKKTKLSKLSKEQKDIYDKYVSPQIVKQISVPVVLAMLPADIKDILNVSVPTLYEYIDRGELKCRNIDLRNKVKRVPKSEKIKPNKSRNRANGRSIHDITEIEKANNNICEMDTVEGIKGGKLLFTLITSKEHFMFGLPISNKTQKNIVANLDRLEKELGYENYKKIFGIIKTDNGVEFLDYDGIEKSKQKQETTVETESKPPEKRSKVFYADPYASWQKALVENNHRIIRYIIEKGYDIGKLTDKEILNIMNRVNNYPRKSLGYSTPYLEMTKIIDEDILKKFGFYHIPIDKLDMKSKKVAN